MKYPMSTAMAALLIAGAGWAVPASAETFEEALISAYQTNPQLQARRAFLRATDEQVPQALSNWRPTVSVDASLAYNLQDNIPDFTAGEGVVKTTPGSVELSVTQNIFRGLRTLAQTDQAEASVKAERATVMSVEQTVLINAARAYLNVLRDEAVADLNANNEQVLRRQLQAAQDRFRVGEITRTDVSQADSRLAGATADRLQAENQVEISRAAYEEAIGHPPVNLTMPTLSVQLPQTRDDASAMAQAKNPDITAARYSWEASQASIRDVKGQLLPTLAAFASGTFAYESSLDDQKTLSAQVGLSLTVPLYQAGSVYSQIREAKHLAGRAKLDIDDTRDGVAQTMTEAWENLQSARARVAAYESQIEAATIALEGVQREAQVGSRTVLDVLDAEQELLTARVNLVRAQNDEAVSTYEVMVALGNMTAQDLGLNTPIYDPTAHYNDVRGQWIGGNDMADSDAAMQPEDPVAGSAGPVATPVSTNPTSE